MVDHRKIFYQSMQYPDLLESEQQRDGSIKQAGKTKNPRNPFSFFYSQVRSELEQGNHRKGRKREGERMNSSERQEMLYRTGHPMTDPSRMIEPDKKKWFGRSSLS